MSQQLPTLVDALFEEPTLDRLDVLLGALIELPRDQPLAGLIDDLLDYRVALAESLAGSTPPISAGDSVVAAWEALR
ncbi:MAG: hypothetical protein JWO57_2050 [Pseudonocardiales bacterium]|nr:hypothetical protein [Pseudonocardiales bacterium]